jgi:hypothetical protein
LRSGLSCYLFIYLVSDDLVRDESTVAPGGSSAGVRGAHGFPAANRYCTVLAYGRSLEFAERIAINRVHQQGLHIVRADTATAAPWLDASQDGDYLAELASYGCALRVTATRAPASAATAA